MLSSFFFLFFFFQAEDGIRDRSPSRGLGDVYKRQVEGWSCGSNDIHLEGNKEGADQRPATAPYSPYNHYPTRVKDSRGNLQKCRSEVDQPRRGASRRS